MKVGLFGYGAMGQLVETQARAASDEIGVIVTSGDSERGAEDLAGSLTGHDVAIDFSVGAAVIRNIKACALAGVPLVEGTTGWKDHEAEARSIVDKYNSALVYGANFSIGVNVFYRIVSTASKLMAGLKEYEAFIEEGHHSRKRDAPSGTAIKLNDLLTANLKKETPIASTRAGHIPGTHRVGFDSAADQLTLTHTARSREGFAAGALVAGHWIIGRKGVYEFSEVIDEILQRDG